MTVDAAALPSADLVVVPRALLARLAEAAGHKQVLVDPVDEIRRGVYPANRAVTYQCATDCPSCEATRLATPPEGTP